MRLPLKTGHTIGLATGAALALVLAITACKGKADTDALDRDLVAGAGNAADADPALTSALADQIMVDPALAAQANDRGVRPVAGPVQAPIPAADIPPGEAPPAPKGLLRAPPPKPMPAAGEMTLAELAQMQAAKRGGQGVAPNCDGGFDYSIGWANRLPPALPIYPGGQVTEAAGSDQPSCGLRVVSFTAPADVAAVIDYYFTQATRARLAPDHRASGATHVLAGSNATGAFYLSVTPRAAGGSEADLVVRVGG